MSVTRLSQARVGTLYAWGAVLTVALVLAAVTGCSVLGQSKPKTFPSAIKGLKTDITYQEAFQRSGIVMPSKITNLHYSAGTGENDGIVAFFSFDCSHSAEFATKSKLRKVGEYDLQDSSVEAFASRFGWKRSVGENSWYMRGTSQNSGVMMMIQNVGVSCTAYIDG